MSAGRAGRAGRGGFALPLVVLLVMVGAIMAAVMLERQAAQQLSANRQVARYATHHVGRGIKEVVATWLHTVQNESISTLVSQNGHALDIELKDGRVVSIYLVDGQGTALGETAGLDGAKGIAVAGIIERLRKAVGNERLAGFMREAGPVAVSANTSPAEVLAAAAGEVLEGPAAETYAQFLIGERKNGVLMPGKLTQAANAAGASPEERTRLTQFVTDKPTLYRLTAEVRGADRNQVGQVLVVGGTKLLDRYSGLVQIETKQSGRGAGSSAQDLLQPLGLFLTWDHGPSPDEP